MSKVLTWLREKGELLFWLVVMIGLCGYAYTYEPKANQPLKDYKDGIQNHLTWDIKGQCFFVRPNDDVTVYLIRVADCDKK